MVATTDAVTAVMMMKELADNEIAWLERWHSGTAIPPISWDEMNAHINVIKTILSSQSAITYMLMNTLVGTGDRIDEVLKKLNEIAPDKENRNGSSNSGG